jgi:hypothetical protein
MNALFVVLRIDLLVVDREPLKMNDSIQFPVFGPELVLVKAHRVAQSNRLGDGMRIMPLH